MCNLCVHEEEIFLLKNADELRQEDGKIKTYPSFCHLLTLSLLLAKETAEEEEEDMEEEVEEEAV